MTEEMIFVRKASGLTRAIGPYSAIFFGLNASMGMYTWLLTTGLSSMYPGADATLAFILAGAIIIIWALPQLELMVSMPRSAGWYQMMARGIHPMFGMMEGWGCMFGSPLLITLSSFFAASFAGASIATVGMTLGNIPLINLGTALATDRNLQLVLSIIFIAIAILADAMGPRTLKRIIVVVMIVSLIGWFVTNGIFFAYTPTTAPSAWNSVWGEGAYQDVVNVATKNGWTETPVSWEATTGSIVMATSPYFGSTNISALGGEVSQPKKSFAIGFVGSIAVLTFLQALMTHAVFSTYGNFISQYDYVINAGFSDQLTVMSPVASNLAFWGASLTTNPLLCIIIGITPVIKCVGMTPGAFVWISRSVFAMSFDRFLPEWFTKVSDRWHSPINAVKWSLGMALACLIICYFALEWVAAITVIVWSYFRTFIIGMAGVALPYEKPHIWERGYKWAIAGVPTLAITGFINTILNMLLMVMGAAGLTFSGACFTALFACLGFFWYWVFAAVNKRRGIDIGRIFATLPPE